jgi:DNA transformation protein and related proteins
VKPRRPRASRAGFAHIEEIFAPFGTIAIRPMFGFHGLFAGDVMFGVLVDESIYLKTDAETVKAYAAERSKPFTFRKPNGERIVTSYFALPERLLDEPDELAQWARRAYEIASTSPTAQRKRRK